jgi:hypothetical protein
MKAAQIIWNKRFWDAIGCGYCEDQAVKIANAAVVEYLND